MADDAVVSRRYQTVSPAAAAPLARLQNGDAWLTSERNRNAADRSRNGSLLTLAAAYFRSRAHDPPRVVIDLTAVNLGSIPSGRGPDIKIKHPSCVTLVTGMCVLP